MTSEDLRCDQMRRGDRLQISQYGGTSDGTFEAANCDVFSYVDRAGMPDADEVSNDGPIEVGTATVSGPGTNGGSSFAAS